MRRSNVNRIHASAAHTNINDLGNLQAPRPDRTSAQGRCTWRPYEESSRGRAVSTLGDYLPVGRLPAANQRPSAALGRAPILSTEAMDLSIQKPSLPWCMGDAEQNINNYWNSGSNQPQLEDFPMLPRRITNHGPVSSPVYDTEQPGRSGNPKRHKATQGPLEEVRLSSDSEDDNDYPSGIKEPNFHYDPLYGPPMTELPVSAERRLLEALEQECVALRKERDQSSTSRPVKIITASSLANNLGISSVPCWPSEGRVEYKPQALPPQPTSPPHISAGATSWFPQGFQEPPKSEKDEQPFWPWLLSNNPEEQVLVDPQYKAVGSFRNPIRRKKTTLPPFIPQFGNSQRALVEAPKNEEEYRANVKPGVRGYAKGEGKRIMESSTCIETFIYVRHDGLSWLCDGCYKMTMGKWYFVHIHRVGLELYQHNPPCPGCGVAPYKVKEAVRCNTCRGVSWLHLDHIEKGIVVCSHPTIIWLDLTTSGQGIFNNASLPQYNFLHSTTVGEPFLEFLEEEATQKTQMQARSSSF
ncbi:hypothetical protein QAD02_018043 [Eretmocerus hayati]|uniref:Uncharacterized protein n=1 Tax=Eretmocerus hayati TaxID=131215 RepID=A0ACC2PFJ6_9HYME|nr:hypothetical protein QAD02_018043 [Eretmocerus hayati]